MLECSRFYTDQNFKKRIISNSSNLRNLKCGIKNDENSKKNEKYIPRYTNMQVNHIKRLTTSNSTSINNKEEYNNKKEEEKRKEELRQKREISFKSRKKIILRLRKSNEENEEIENKNNEKNIRKIEINLKDKNPKFKRINSNNNIGFNNYLKQIYKDMGIKTTKIINSRNSDIDNDVNAHKRNSYIINYKKRNSNEHLNEISYTAGIQNDQKQNYILKNVRHIYKKNRQALNEKKCKIMKINKIDEINSHSFINNDKNKNYTFIKENINKNEEDIKKEIDEENYNKNINNNTYKNLKYFYNMNMTNNIYSNNNNYNTPLLSKSKLTRINSDFLNSCKLQLNNKNGNSDEKICFSFYNNLIPKDKIKTNINNENNKYSNRSFKIENHTHHHKMYNKPHMINIKALPHNGKFKSIESEKSPIKDKKIINKNEFIIEFFEILIDISNSINNRNLFGNLIYNFNQKFFMINENEDIDENNDSIFKDNENFEYVYKHFCLILISLIFFSKDDNLYNSFYSKIQELLIQIIYSSLNYVEMENNNDSNKIYQFTVTNNYQSIISIHRYVLSLMKLLFNNKKEYTPLKEALDQIYSIINKKNYKFILKIINESILFCYNSKPKAFTSSPFLKFSNIAFIKELKDNTNYNQQNISNNEKVESIPFIKSPMKKKFCLVLDIDETISHTLKLTCGGYFLLRPGTKNFLEKIEKFYEIIIFTSSPKKYADKILDKIDINKNIFSHRLYKNHVLYENGKSIKNLNLIGRDLTKTIFIDNLRSNAKYNLDNLCPITTWKSDIFDDSLIRIKDKLIHIATCGKYDDDITQGL